LLRELGGEAPPGGEERTAERAENAEKALHGLKKGIRNSASVNDFLLYFGGREARKRELNAETQRRKGGMNNKSQTASLPHPAGGGTRGNHGQDAQGVAAKSWHIQLATFH